MISLYRKMACVDRLAGKYKIRNYNLVFHQYYVALFFMHFAEKEHIEYDVKVIDFILKHDIYEVLTNDLPWECKNLNDITKECWKQIEKEVGNCYKGLELYSDEQLKKCLNLKQYLLFKAMDYLELFIFIKEEKMLGNSNTELMKIADRCIELIKGKFKSVDEFLYKENCK